MQRGPLYGRRREGEYIENRSEASSKSVDPYLSGDGITNP